MPGTGSLIRKAELWRKKEGVEQSSGTYSYVAPGGPNVWYYSGTRVEGNFTVDSGWMGQTIYAWTQMTVVQAGTITKVAFKAITETHSTTYKAAVYNSDGTVLLGSGENATSVVLSWLNEVTVNINIASPNTVIRVAVAANGGNQFKLAGATQVAANLSRYKTASTYAAFPYTPLDAGSVVADTIYAIRVYVD